MDFSGWLCVGFVVLLVFGVGMWETFIGPFFNSRREKREKKEAEEFSRNYVMSLDVSETEKTMLLKELLQCNSVSQVESEIYYQKHPETRPDPNDPFGPNDYRGHSGGG